MEDSTITNNQNKIKPFYAIKIFEKGKELDPDGKNTIHLSLGEPSDPLPDELLKEVGKKLLNYKIGYTESIGMLELRKAVAKHYLSRYKININVDQIAITSGASASILLSLMSSFKQGDTIAVISPGYPCYVNILKALNLNIHNIQTNIEDNYNINLSDIENIPKFVKGIILASPSNPTGAMIELSHLKEISRICMSKKILIISDEIYQGISYQNNLKELSLLSINHKGVVINSFSKYFLMTGWRLGWIISNKEHIKEISKLAMNLYLSPSSISQFTALEVFKYYEYFDNVVNEYKRKRNLLKTELVKIGLKDFFFPEGAFYFYIDVSKYTRNSYSFCKDMVNDINVTTAPGIDFDTLRGSSFIRISFAGSKKDLMIAIKKMGRWL